MGHTLERGCDGYPLIHILSRRNNMIVSPNLPQIKEKQRDNKYLISTIGYF